MRLLRYLYILALVVWLGGIVVAGAIVAPSIFGVLQEWNPVEGRVLAGRVFGEVLNRLHWLAYAMGSVMFVALPLPRPSPTPSSPVKTWRAFSKARTA